MTITRALYDKTAWEVEEEKKDDRAIRAILKDKWILENKSFGMFDIETTNLNASIGEILCASIKPLGKKATTYSSTKGDRTIITEIRDALHQFDYVVTFYGSRFDLPFLATRLKVHGVSPIGHVRHLDMYYTARSHLALHSNRLQVVSETLFNKSSKTRIIGNIWNSAGKGDKDAMKYIMKHCEEDVKELERVFKALIEFRNLGATPLKVY